MAMEDDKKAEQGADASDSGGGGKSSIVKWALVCAILLMFIGIEVGIAVFFVNRLKEPDLADTQREEDEKKEAALKEQTRVGATLASPIEVTVNINGEDGRYLKCGIQLEYDPSSERLGTELEARKARIKDIVIEILSNSPYSELMTNDGKKAIRDRIVTEVNGILPNEMDGKPLGKVYRCYFDSFIMQ